MKGFIFPVKLDNFQRFKERVKRDGNTTFSFGLHIDITNESEGEVEIHVPLDLISYCYGDIDEMMCAVHEMTNLNFSFYPKKWLLAKLTDIKEHDLVVF